MDQARRAVEADPDHPAVGAATALLADYAPGARFLGTPTRTLLGQGVHSEVPHDGRPLAARVAHTLAAAREAGVDAPVVIGAVPFDQEAPAALAVPAALHSAPPLAADPLIALPAQAPAAVDWRIRQVPAPGHYGKAVAAAVDRMWRGEFSKVVLARTLELDAPDSAEPVDVAAMLQRLARRDPSGYTFALPTGPERTLIGASPELLVSRRGHQVVANPLAGSVPRSADLAEDVRRAAALLRSSKDLHEHAVVVDAVHQALAPYCADLTVPAAPTLIRTAAMWHLSTTVTATLATPETSALELACALHPTPAVCGTPTATAREVIRESEPFDRGFFTGMVGWGDASGDGEWVVTIRCAEAERTSLRLYAGAGVVAASEPEAETAETAAKFRTFLAAVGAEL
ncbi:isochorismate synthase DhbC [Streptomyces sp. AN091965]|uniref:isochorismate synthase DhbC n=1 Tax=Streptomyces sp. AN091965 TaxID=2927803 RepID=UPI001F616E41|nr:isochorismate synthase DhbC [Streptomyces sp. AN091965]MCI3928449.1 isochorismate synthase DhbC [Streptomyces sp. AN091965]